MKKSIEEVCDEIIKAKYISRTGSAGNYKYKYKAAAELKRITESHELRRIEELKKENEASQKKPSKDLYDVKKYIDDNPQDADNMEDLLNWTVDHFEIHDDKKMIDEVWRHIRDNSDLPK